MSRHTGVWLLSASVLGLFGMVSTQGCESDTSDTNEDAEGTRVLGDLALGLVLPDGSNVTDPTYTITRTSQPSFSLTGKLSISGLTASGTISGLEAGNDYKVVLSAVRSAPAGAPPCTGSATFQVVSSQTTNVTVVLQCDDTSGDVGNVTINGSYNICPKISSTSATPTSTTVGSSIALTANASDKDVGDVVTYSWSATDGTFSSTSAAVTSYTCTTAGTKSISLSVTDGPTRGCIKQATPFTVTCLASGLDAGTGTDAGSDASIGSDAGVGSDAGFVVNGPAPAYILPSAPGVLVNAFLTVGESRNLKPDGVTPYRMVGIPDGLGAFDNGDGTFTLLSNHEISTGGTPSAPLGIARAHGGKGAFVSKWQVKKSDLTVLHGQDLIQSVQLFDKTTSTYSQGSNVAFQRFCSADLAPQSAFYDAASSTGFAGRLFLNGEELGVEGRALAHGLDGVTYELPALGRQSWENQVASPASGLKTVVISQDDTSPAGQVFVYVGTKTNVGASIARAGLSNGTLYGIKVTGVPTESNASVIPAGTAFTLASLGNVASLTGAQIEAAAATAGVTGFQRPEDGAWDPSHPNDYYFVTTASITSNSRLWRLRFSDVKNPELGGTIEALLDGSEGHRMLDNITLDERGHLIALEDVGNDARLGKVWRYTIATDSFVEIAAFDPARFSAGAPGFLTIDEETSGVIDATALLGAGWYLLDVQAHYARDAELVEGGQFVALYDPGSL